MTSGSASSIHSNANPVPASELNSPAKLEASAPQTSETTGEADKRATVTNAGGGAERKEQSDNRDKGDMKPKYIYIAQKKTKKGNMIKMIKSSNAQKLYKSDKKTLLPTDGRTKNRVIESRARDLK